MIIAEGGREVNDFFGDIYFKITEIYFRINCAFR